MYAVRISILLFLVYGQLEYLRGSFFLQFLGDFWSVFPSEFDFGCDYRSLHEYRPARNPENTSQAFIRAVKKTEETRCSKNHDENDECQLAEKTIY